MDWLENQHILGRPKKLKPAASGTRFTGWIGGMCYADTLQVWFPAHWAPLVIRQLQRKEDEYRAANPSWVDQTEAPDDIRQQWREAEDAVQGESSEIRMLTGTLKADWIQLPVERYLAVFPTLKQRCHCRRVEDQRCFSLGDYQGREATSLCVPSQ